MAVTRREKVQKSEEERHAEKKADGVDDSPHLVVFVAADLAGYSGVADPECHVV